MVNNTTLAMFALIAALGLVTAMLVVEPIMVNADPSPVGRNSRQLACDHSGADANAPFCQ